MPNIIRCWFIQWAKSCTVFWRKHMSYSAVAQYHDITKWTLIRQKSNSTNLFLQPLPIVYTHPKSPRSFSTATSFSPSHDTILQHRGVCRTVWFFRPAPSTESPALKTRWTLARPCFPEIRSFRWCHPITSGPTTPAALLLQNRYTIAPWALSANPGLHASSQSQRRTTAYFSPCFTLGWLSPSFSCQFFPGPPAHPYWPHRRG